MYDTDISHATLSSITDKNIPEVKHRGVYRRNCRNEIQDTEQADELINLLY